MARNTLLGGGKVSIFSSRGKSRRRFAFVGALIGLITLYIWFASRLDIEDIRTEIERALQADVAFEVTVGDIGWGWLSGFGITLQDVVVRTRESRELLVSIDAIYLEVALVPLMAGAPQITLNKVEANGVRTKFEALAVGGGYLWEQDEGDEPKARSLFEALVPVPRRQSAASRRQSRVIFNPDEARLRDVVIDYTSLKQGYLLRFDEINLSGMQAEVKEAQVRLAGRLETFGEGGVAFDLAGRAFVPLRGLSAGRLEVADAGVRRQVLDLERGSAKPALEERPSVTEFFTPLQIPWRLHVEQGEVRLADGTAYATRIDVRWLDETFELNGELSGDLSVTLANMVVNEPFSDLNWEGNLHIRATDVERLRETTDAPVPAALKSFSLEGDFSAVERGFYSDHAAVILNSEVFVGDLLVVFDEQVKIRLNAQGRQFNLEPWLSYAAPAADTGTIRATLAAAFRDDSPMWSEEQQEAAAGYRWEILLHLDRMIYAGLTMYKADFLSQFDGKHINAQISSDNTLGGQFDARVAVDLEPELPVWQVRFDTARTNLTEFNQWLKLRLGASGVVAVDGYATMVGRSKNELLDSLAAAMNVRSENGWLDITAIKQRALHFAAATAEEQVVAAWPEQFQFSNLSAGLSIPAGFDNQRFEVRVDGLAIEATGYVDPLRELMQLDVSFSLVEDLFTGSLKARSGYFRNLKWPVNCRGRYTRHLPCRLLDSAHSQVIAELLEAKERRLASATNWRSPFNPVLQLDAGIINAPPDTGGEVFTPDELIQDYLRQSAPEAAEDSH